MQLVDNNTFQMVPKVVPKETRKLFGATKDKGTVWLTHKRRESHSSA